MSAILLKTCFLKKFLKVNVQQGLVDMWILNLATLKAALLFYYSCCTNRSINTRYFDQGTIDFTGTETFANKPKLAKEVPI